MNIAQLRPSSRKYVSNHLLPVMLVYAREVVHGSTVNGPNDGEVVQGCTVNESKDGEVVHGSTVNGPNDGIQSIQRVRFADTSLLDTGIHQHDGIFS